ncbi:MAG: TonB-dependent receptor [Goleter apudmare HA4340-LM2]|nr:TonB-dependent receptor [Goleter apudmare HA4340-LM2]
MVQSLLLTGTFAVLVITPALSQEVQDPDVSLPLLHSGKIPRTNPLKRSLINTQKLVQSPTPNSPPANEIIEVTGIKVNPTDKGVEVTLETLKGEQLQVVPKSQNNTYIADIPNVQLRLPNGDTFRQDNPVTGITEVTVTNFDASTIRITVTGAASVPTVELFDSDQGLIFSFIPTASTPQPQSEAPPIPENQPIELTVTGERDGYSVPDATTATRTDTPLRDIPQSIQIIPQQVLKDQQATRLTDALRNVSGITEGNTFGGSKDVFVIRGFEQENIFRDGFRGTRNLVIRETANLERIEVLKGPASVLFGALEPGGVVNLVTKKPLSTPFYAAELQVGNFGLVRPSIDFSGPLSADGSLLYRLNAVYESADGFRGLDQGIDRVFISPVLSWKISDRTDFTLAFEYLDDSRPRDRGIVAIDNGVANIPYNRFLGEPGDFNSSQEFNISYQLEHRFNDNWKLRNAFRFSTTDESRVGAEPSSFDAATGELTREWYDGRASIQSYALQTNLVGNFTTGSIKHQLLFGIDLNRDVSSVGDFFDFANAPSINIFNPVYGLAPRPRRNELPDQFFFDDRIDILGIYLQDQIELADNFKLLVGGRLDIVNQENRFRDVSGTDITSTQQVDAFTPRIGIVYQPIKPLSLYASYSQSFVPNSGTTASGSLLEPQRGTQYEVGIRGEFLDNKLSFNLAAYHLTKSNIATSDLDPSNIGFSVAIGEQTSQGIELDVSGEILPGWNVIASYAYTDAKITQDNDLTVGNILVGVPQNAASLWTTYQIQQGSLQGLGLGMGVFFVDERQGDLSNSFQVPSYVRTDASLFYKKDNWRAGINIKNLFDVDYIESASRNTRINPGAPFTIIGTVSIEF